MRNLTVKESYVSAPVKEIFCYKHTDKHYPLLIKDLLIANKDVVKYMFSQTYPTRNLLRACNQYIFYEM